MAADQTLPCGPSSCRSWYYIFWHSNELLSYFVKHHKLMYVDIWYLAHLRCLAWRCLAGAALIIYTLTACHMSCDETCRECPKETWQSRCIDVCNKGLASLHKTSHGVLHYSMTTLSVFTESLYDGTLEISDRCTGWYILSASALQGPVAHAKRYS